MYKLPTYFLLLIVTISCQSSGSLSEKVVPRTLKFEEFGGYWYKGQAEVSSFALEQYRYGEKREGEAVLIFVTEDFSKEKQVKLDYPATHQKDAQKVLKLNMTKNFVTGIYPYSMMLSVFTPVYDKLPAQKVAASVQEWCGQTYTQLNYQNGSYAGQLFSYFENESTQELRLEGIPEDHLWTLLRLHPDQVPTGKVSLIPALLDQRLTHAPLKAEEATIAFIPAPEDLAGISKANLRVLEIVYADYPREVHLFFRNSFPYDIIGWTETRRLEGGKKEVSTAVRKAIMMSDYWSRNKQVSEPLRRELKLNY